MELGPIEMLVVKFPGNQFTGEIMPVLLEPDVFGIFSPLVTDVTPLLNEEDAFGLAASLENNPSAGLLLFENVLATRFADAIRAAKGEVLLNERIPRVVVEDIVAANG
jgi:hypothetical protein